MTQTTVSETRTLVVTTFDSRREVQVPTAFITGSGTSPSRQLMSFLRESEIAYPEDAMLTETNDSLVMHAVPKFGA